MLPRTPLSLLSFSRASLLVSSLLTLPLGCAPTPGTTRVSYADLSYWQRYQEYFPVSLRLSPTTMPQESWWAWRGHQVHLDRTLPVGAPLARVVLVHGGGGNGRLLSPFAVMLARAGYEVVAPDFPGFGLTLRDPKEPLSYGLWVDLLGDLLASEQRDGLPVFLFGLSLGGTTVYHAAARNDRVAGLIATTLLDPREAETRHSIASSRTLSKVGGWLSATFPSVTDDIWLGVSTIAPVAKISNHPDLARLIAKDPLIGRGALPLRFYRTLAELAPALEPEQFTTCPVLLVHPGADPWTPVALSRSFFDRIAADKRLVLLDQAGHIPLEEPGVTQLQQAAVSFIEDRRRAWTGRPAAISPTR